jgi:hypothetical protein
VTKAILALALGFAVSTGVARAGDTKPSDEAPPKKEASGDCDQCNHGFFHPFSKFWVHTVGGRMSYGLKSFAGNVRHGIGGGGKD